jgi:lipopolysaccharide/colanic/teichoic acid biosynthesis glycosyltransferase
LIEQMSTAPLQPGNTSAAPALSHAEARAVRADTRADLHLAKPGAGRAELHLVGAAPLARSACAAAARRVTPDEKHVGWARVRHLFARAAGRALDLLVAGALLLVLSPLLLAIALAVRVETGGPALFRQRRVGRGLHEFTMLKFRTMHSGADATPHREYVQALIGDDRSPERGRLYKLSVDNRVTGVGRVLRSWSLDELPQLINVLLGQMALVGPRPVIPYEVEMYPDASYLSRFDVKPGLTGLWQVSGRNERTYEEMVDFDLQYAREASLLLDLRILIKTVPVVLGRQGVA